MIDGVPAVALRSNLRRFMLFRVGFNARFYYPVFTILFLDYGLTLEQFSILNLVWAVTIVLAEVPSGALADLFGRRRLLTFASALMVIEMALLAFVPLGASSLLFAVFLVNRVCSGLAEAAASGADEALAYDSLIALNRQKDWARILELTGRAVSAGFFFTMITGALAYDAAFVNAVISHFNETWQLPREVIIRFPVYLTLITACIVLIATLGMREIAPQPSKFPASSPIANPLHDHAAALPHNTLKDRLTQPFAQVLTAAKWTIGHRFVLIVIIAALVLDSVARQLIILASEYYRIIQIPTAWFGFIGAGIALLGFATASFSRYLVTRHSPFFNFLILSAIIMTGLIGVTFQIPWWGVLFSTCVFSLLSMVNFQTSYYLNREVDSAMRATVLSFKGLAFNLGLGMASLLYTMLIVALKSSQDPILSDSELKETVFIQSLNAFPFYFAVLFVMVLFLAKLLVRRRYLCFQTPEPQP